MSNTKTIRELIGNMDFNKSSIFSNGDGKNSAFEVLSRIPFFDSLDKKILKENHTIENFKNMQIEYKFYDKYNNEILISDIYEKYEKLLNNLNNEKLTSYQKQQINDKILSLKKDAIDIINKIRNKELFLNMKIEELGENENGEEIVGAVSNFLIRVDLIDHFETHISMNGTIIQMQELFNGRGVLLDQEKDDKLTINFPILYLNLRNEIEELKKELKEFRENITLENQTYPLNENEFYKKQEEKQENIISKLNKKIEQLNEIIENEDKNIFYPTDIKNCPLGVTNIDIKKIYKKVNEILKSKEYATEIILDYMSSLSPKEVEAKNKLSKIELKELFKKVIKEKLQNENHSIVYKINQYLSKESIFILDDSKMTDTILNILDQKFTFKELKEMQIDIQSEKMDLIKSKEIIREYSTEIDTLNSINKSITTDVLRKITKLHNNGVEGYEIFKSLLSISYNKEQIKHIVEEKLKGAGVKSENLKISDKEYSTFFNNPIRNALETLNSTDIEFRKKIENSPLLESKLKK